MPFKKAQLRSWPGRSGGNKMRNGMMNRDASKNTVWLLLCNGSPLHAHILMTATSLPKNSWCHKPTLQQAEQQAEKNQLLLLLYGKEKGNSPSSTPPPQKKKSWKTATVNKKQQNSGMHAGSPSLPPLRQQPFPPNANSQMRRGRDTTRWAEEEEEEEEEVDPKRPKTRVR